MEYHYRVLGLVCIMLAIPFRSDAIAQTLKGVEDERLVSLIRVDSDSISLGLFKKSYVDFLIATGGNDTEGHRYRHIQALTDAYVLGNDARRRGMVRDSAFQQFSRLQRKKALGGRFYERSVIDNVVALSDEEKRIAYAKYMSKVHVRQMYFEREKEATFYFDRLEGGDDFVDLANEVYKTAEYDSSAGDMGFISYFEVDDAIAEAAFGLNNRFEYSRPVRSRKGYHILRLENRIVNPILTESAYQAHGKGVGEEMHLRAIRMEGDAFVRAFMDSLKYTLEEEAVHVLAEQIKTMVAPDEKEPQAIFLGHEEELSFQEADHVRKALSPETPLIHYYWDGKEQRFTAGDFLAWIYDIPYAEIKANPVASVGRALRNEVMALAGEKMGLSTDPIVIESVLFEEQIYLASKVKEALRLDTSITPTPEMVRAAFDRLAQNRTASVRVDYWKIETATLEEAEHVLKQLEEGHEQPTHFLGYQNFTKQDAFVHPEWSINLRQAPLRKPMVAGLTGGRWVVFEVTQREEKTFQFEEVRVSLEKQLAPYAGEYFLLKQLYESATVEIDHAWFDTWPTVNSLPQE